MKFLNFLICALVYSFSALFLSGCFLKQQPPKGATQGQNQTKIEALMRLEEMRGEATLSVFSASFAKEVASTKRLAGFREALTVAELKRDLRRGETYCNGYKMPKAMDGDDDETGRAAKYLSAGKLWFGQGMLTEIPEQSNHRYMKELSADLAIGAYSSKVEGNTEVPGFEMGLSLPEPLVGVEIDQTVAHDAVTFKKGGPLHLAWNPASVSKPEHIMLLEVYSDGDPTYLYFIRCIAMESDTVKNGKQHWTIDAKYPGVLPATTKGELFLSRLLARQAANSAILVESQGMQTHFASITID